MKKIELTVVAVVLALALAGCSFSSTVTRTETVTDANGKTTTHTTTTTNDNGKVTSTESVEVVDATEATTAAAETEAAPEVIVATLCFNNQTGVDVYSLNFSSALSDDWGANILKEGDVMKDGDTIIFHDCFPYDATTLVWDMRIADSDGTTLGFKGLDLSKAADPQNIHILMTKDAETNSYVAIVE